jgi:hypothetical protein
MSAQDFAAERLDFALEYDVEASLLEAKIEPADSGKERGDFVRQSLTSERNKLRIPAGRIRPALCQAIAVFGSPPPLVCSGGGVVARVDR